MKNNLFIATALAAAILVPQGASATCKGNFRLELGHTIPQQWSMNRDTNCSVVMNFDYVAFYGLSVRQAPKNGSIRVSGNGFVYTPRKGFTGTDQFIMDAEGAHVSWQSGAQGQRLKAGMAIAINVQ